MGFHEFDHIFAQHPDRDLTVEVEVAVPKCRDLSHHRRDLHPKDRHRKGQGAGVMMERDQVEDLCPLKVMDINVNTMANVHLDLVAMETVSVRDQEQDPDRTVEAKVEVGDREDRDRDRNHHRKDRDQNDRDQAAGATMGRDLEEDLCPLKVVVGPKCRDLNHHRRDRHRRDLHPKGPHRKGQGAGAMMVKDLEEDLCLLKVKDINVNTMGNVHLDSVAMETVSVRDQEQDPDHTVEAKVEVVDRGDRDRNHHREDQVPNALDPAAGAMMGRDPVDLYQRTVTAMNANMIPSAHLD